MAQAASKTCEICVSAPGSCFCLDCEQCFCENCKVLHSRQKISANHEFKETSDFIPEVKSKCTDHNEVFSFVCIACDVPVCACCVTEKHNGHKLSQLKDTIANLNSKIEQEILMKLSETSGNVCILEKNLASFSDQVQTVITSVTEQGNKIKSMVDQYTTNIIASLQKQAQNERGKLSSTLSSYNTALGRAYILVDRTRSFDKQRDDGTLVKMLKILKEDIDKLDVCPLPEFPSITYTPKVVKVNNISHLFGKYELCETKKGADRKSENMHSSLRRNIIYTCRTCGKQKMKNPYTNYCADEFSCCHMSMERKT